jgi:6-phosphogluconolactonase
MIARIVRAFDGLDALSEDAVDEIVRVATRSIAERGRFSIALSGGSTPKRTYELLAKRTDVDWAKTEIFFGDDRFVAADDPRSNYKMAREALLAHLPIPAANVHAIPTNAATVEAAAELYDRTLRDRLGQDVDGCTVDLALLGLGPDGHTASLFPNDAPVSEQSRWAVAVAAPTAVQPSVPRVSTTLPFLNAARMAIFLIAGTDKRPVVAEILGRAPGASRYPAGMIAPRDFCLWMVDRSILPPDWPNA